MTKEEQRARLLEHLANMEAVQELLDIERAHELPKFDLMARWELVDGLLAAGMYHCEGPREDSDLDILHRVLSRLPVGTH